MAPERPSYAMTKNSSTLLIQQIAKDTIPDDMQIISFHPGAVETEEVTRRMGGDAGADVPFDDGTSSYNFTYDHKQQDDSESVQRLTCVQ
jgi:hypothetical protein